MTRQLRWHDVRVDLVEDGGLVSSSLTGSVLGDTAGVNATRRIDEALLRSVGRVAEKAASWDEQLDVGQRLGQLLLPPPLRAVLKDALGSLPDDEALRLGVQTSGAVLDMLPWEFTHVPSLRSDLAIGPYLVLHDRISLVRRVSRSPELDRVRLPKRPLRAVLAAATAVPGYARLQASEATIVATTLLEAGWECSVSGDPVRREQLRIETSSPHALFHFVGHGGPEGQLLVLADDLEGRLDLVDIDELGTALVAAGVEIVVLNACRTGFAGSPRSPANHLIGLGIPAVVSMQHAVEDSHAIAFARAFYESLLRAEGIDQAMSRGRAAMNTGVLSDWGVPVLHLRGSPPEIITPTAAVGDRVTSPRRRVRFRVPALVDGFSGRDAELEALGATAGPASTGIRCQVVTGMGGVGKTQLSTAYLHRRADSYDIVAWIRAEEAGGTADLAELADVLGIAHEGASPSESASRVRPHLEASDSTWLLVLDNIAGPSALRDVPTSGHGEILATSRTRGGYESFGTEVPLDTFDSATATAYLVARTGRVDEAVDAATVADLLGGLPLALSHAASVCELSLGLRFTDYIELLEHLRAEELFDDSRDSLYETTVALTWAASRSMAMADSSRSVAVTEMAAFLAPDGIQLTLFDLPGADARVRKETSDAIRALRRYSLLDVVGGVARMHRVLQKVVRDSLPPTSARDAMSAVVQALTEARPATTDDPADWRAWQDLVPHIRSLARSVVVEPVEHEAVVELLHGAVEFLVWSGAPQEALETADQALTVATKLIGPDHQAMVGIRHVMAQAMHLAGDIEAAIRELESLLEQVRGDHNVPGDTIADVATTLAAAYESARRSWDAIDVMTPIVESTNLSGSRRGEATKALAASCLSVGRARAAVELLQSIEATGTINGSTTLDTINRAILLASARRAAGDLEEARELGAHIAVEADRALGADHPASLTAWFDLASTERCAGRLEHAMSIEERVVAARARVLGPRHTETLWARGNLALSLQSIGRTDEAIRAARQIVAERRAAWGDEHSSTLTAFANLAISLRAGGQVDEAIEIQEMLVEARSRVIGPRHFSTLSARDHLGISYRCAGRIREAVSTGEGVVADRTAFLGEHHPATLSAVGNLAMALRLDRQQQRSLQLVDQVVDGLATGLGATHPDSLWAHRERAATLAELGRASDAAAEAEEVLLATSSVLGDTHPYTTWAEAVLDAIRSGEDLADVDRRFGCERILWE